LLAGANQVIGKRPRGRIVGTGVAPEFMPKHNCADIGNRDQTADDAAPLEIGELRVFCRLGWPALPCSCREYPWRRRGVPGLALAWPPGLAPSRGYR
jgi:hypothetical protein